MIFTALIFAASTALARNQNEPSARRDLEKFVSCTVRTKRGIASQAIIENWSIPMTIERDLITADCLDSGTLQPPGPAMLGAIGERLAVTEEPSLPPQEVAKAPALRVRAFDDYVVANEVPRAAPSHRVDPRLELDGYRRYVAITQLGECIVRSNAQGAWGLLSTRLASRDETAGAEVLVASAASCFGGGSQNLPSAEMVRTAVGLVYHRMEMAARGVTWTSRKDAK